jgi:hypothetical protein
MRPKVLRSKPPTDLDSNSTGLERPAPNKAAVITTLITFMVLYL